MKILSAVAILAFLPQSFGLQGDFDERYGHEPPSCVKVPITDTDTTLKELEDLASQGNSDDPVSIPCGSRVTAVQGETYNLKNGMEVLGELVFLDDPDSDKETIVKAPYILVRGRLQAGTPSTPFMSKLRFVLTEFKNKPDDHYNLTVNHVSDNDLFDGTMNFGDKAFVVYGGEISLCGPLEGKKIIAKLAKTVKPGVNRMFVKGDWSKYWKSGDHVAMASTSNNGRGGFGSAREFIIKSSKYKKKGKKTLLRLSEKYFAGECDALSFAKANVVMRTYEGKKKKVLKTAEVFKLTRNIVIQGIPVGDDLTEFMNNDSRGGHFVVAHTAKRQIIQGVEFSAMGQKGILGRYPIHFHSCGNVDSETVLQYNSVHHSKQRCVVVHATNDLTVRQNSAFMALDHCFMTEDGYEQGNTFSGNIAVSVERSAFWMATPTNDLIDNVAANAAQGFDISEFAPCSVTGGENFSMKHEIPCLKLGGGDNGGRGCTLSRWLPMGIFDGNVAHNVGTGILIYPPRYASYPQRMDDMDTLENFFAWNVYNAYDSVSSNMELINFTVIGATTGINIHSGSNIWITKSAFQDVCNGVRISETRWNVLHSGVEVNQVAFHRISEKSDRCAVIVFRVTGRIDDLQFGKVSTQVKNVKLYKVKQLFAFEDDYLDGSILTNTSPYGLYVYNILSYNSKMKHIAPASSNDAPSYVIRHGYGGNLVDTSNSLVSSCEKSLIGGYPSSDEFFVCKECWRPIAIIFKRVLGNNNPVSIKFVSESGNTFFFNESPILEYLSPINYIHAVQVIPAAKYEIFLVDGEMNELSEQLQNQADIRFYHADQRYKGFETQPENYGCFDNVILGLNGKILSVSDLSDVHASYPSA